MEEVSANVQSTQQVSQEQIHGLLFGDKLSWQAIIYDLISTEQLNPWDIDISLLANKYLERVRQIEEANFFVSSKVLLAAALLLRIKSEILLSRDIPSLDEALFGKKEEKKYVQERIELDDEIPELVVRTPLPRFKKVTLQELMSALGHAIKTENRRIKKIALSKQQEFEVSLSVPKQRINIQGQIREVYSKLENIFSKRETKLPFSELAGDKIEDRIATFIPLLHLDSQQKVWLEQNGHFEEIWILLKSIYEKQNFGLLEKLKQEVEEDMKSFNAEQKERIKEIEKDFANPLSEGIEDSLEDDEEESENLKKEESPSDLMDAE